MPPRGRVRSRPARCFARAVSMPRVKWRRRPRRAVASYAADGRALARRNLDVMQETYALGRVTLFDVVNEQRRYLDFESSYTDVLAELFAAVTALGAATGDIR